MSWQWSKVGDVKIGTLEKESAFAFCVDNPSDRPINFTVSFSGSGLTYKKGQKVEVRVEAGEKKDLGDLVHFTPEGYSYKSQFIVETANAKPPVHPHKDGKASPGGPSTASSTGQLCVSSGCNRPSWNGSPGSLYCRSCWSSNGMGHGPTCDQNFGGHGGAESLIPSGGVRPRIPHNHRRTRASSCGGSRHLLGIEPALHYIPIRDFAKNVTPWGTAREVFEKDVPAALPKVAKWVPWLSGEAQKIAKGILQKGQQGNLTPQQVYACIVYTLDVRIADGTLEENFYFNLNPVLQTRELAALDKLEGFLHYFMSGMEAIQPEPEQVFSRGIPKSSFDVIAKNYKTGKAIHWSGFSSVSTNATVSKDFALSEGPGGVVFHVTARSGRRISHLSAIPTEAEVLLLPNFRAVVFEVSKDPVDDVYVVKLVEKDDDVTYVF